MAREPLRIVGGTSGIVKEQRPIDDGSRGIVGETSSNVAAREGSKVAPLRSKRSRRDFVASDSESCPVRPRSVTSHEELEKSSSRSMRNGRAFQKSLGGIQVVHREPSANGARLPAVSSRCCARSSRCCANSARFVDDDRRKNAGREGVQTAGARFAKSGAGLSIAPSYPYMLTCPDCPFCAGVNAPRLGRRRVQKAALNQQHRGM